MTKDNQDHQSHPNENLVVDKPDPDPADEADGSRPERPQSRGVTRRALLGGTALGAGLLAYTSDYEDGGVTHSIARAATVPDEPLITVGAESDPVGYIFESNGDWVFKHEASGNEFFYNSAQDRWEAGTLAIESLVDVYDYIVSTDDDLNDIINNQVSAGDSVWIGKGTHTVTKSQARALDITVADVTVDGIGTLKLEDGAASNTGNSDDEGVIGISADGVTIRGITIDGNKANQSPASDTDRISGIHPNDASDYHIENVEVKNCTNGGIKNGSTTGVGGRIDNCHVHDCQKDGIHVTEPELTGEGNRVEDLPNQDGIEPVGDNQTWRGNVVKNVTGSGFDVFDAAKVTVADNIIIQGANGPQSGIAFNGASSPGAKACVAEGNIFVGSGETGATATADRLLEVGTQVGCKAIGNVSIGANTPIQIGDKEFTFSNNVLVDCVGQGLHITGGAPDLTLRGNYFINGGAMDLQIQSAVTSATVEDNTFIDSTGRAIEVNGDQVTLKDNHISGGDAGIRAPDGPTGLSCIDNTVEDIADGGRAFNLANVDETRLIGNTTRNCGGTSTGGGAVLINIDDGGSHSELVLKDHYSKNDHNGIRLQGNTGSLDNVTVRDNTVIGNNFNTFEFTLGASDYLIQNQDGWTEAAGGETTVDDGGTIAHGLSETPDRYYVESKDSGEYAHVTSVDGTNLTVEVLTVSDGSAGGTGNNVVWEAKAPSAP